MGLKPADMGSCKKKKQRCVFGVNEGVAYTPGDECTGPSEVFDPDICDCYNPIPLGNYIIYYRQDSGGPTRCSPPHDPVCRRRCYSVQWNNVQSIESSSTTTTNFMCCGVQPGCSAASFENNFFINGLDANGVPIQIGTGLWYSPGSSTNSNQTGGTYINNFYVTGIQDASTGQMVAGYDCSLDPDLCGGGHPNGECTSC